MKSIAAALVLVCLGTSALAQQTAQQQQPAPPVKMECRDLSTSGNVVYPNETLVNGMACPVVDTKPAIQPATSIPQTKAVSVTPAPAQSPVSTQPSASAPAPAEVPAPPISTRIISGATVFISPMEGFENYLAAAFQKKGVPLVPVGSEEQATYVLKGTSEEKKPGAAKIIFMGQIHADNAASVQMMDRRTGAIVFAYAVNKKNTLHGQQTTAEACAKHLKEQIERK
jgi:hypothetical protein